MKKFVLGLSILMGVTYVQAQDINLGACVSCHGAQFEKSALNKSKIVKDMTKADIEASLKGYLDGTYGGSMKGIMVAQTSKYKDNIPSLAEMTYLSAHKDSLERPGVASTNTGEEMLKEAKEQARNLQK